VYLTLSANFKTKGTPQAKVNIRMQKKNKQFL